VRQSLRTPQGWAQKGADFHNKSQRSFPIPPGGTVITKDIEIEDLAKEYPKAVGLLLKKGIVCIQCGAPIWGTLEEIARRKGVQDIDALVAELNESVTKQN
jgi:methionine synthase II (cobalamin-independent)